MKGYQMSSGLCLIVLSVFALQTQFATASYSMSETCQQYSEGYIANPDNCQGYGYCRGGVLIGTGTCKDGFLYDSNGGICDYAANVTCMSKLESTCSVVGDPVYVADPDDCTRACYCNNGKYSCTSCPQYQVFNPNTRSCVYSSQYSCPASSICRLVPNNKFVGDPNNCGNFIQCVGGAGLSQLCPNNLHYNAVTGYCATDPPNCGNSPPSPTPPSAGPGVLQNLPTNSTACLNYKTPPSGNSYFVSDGTTCMGFYVCDNTDGPGTWYKCPFLTHFDEEEQKCVTPYSVRCPYDRCGNLNQTFVADLGCTSYSYCITQTKQNFGGNTCKAVNFNYQYFNEVASACVNQDPAYPICTSS
ncbi:peritrophin-44 isoform X2 [Stomoxys calcitrans]|uniref:peritrophin-44 isoform X1 n=1 Tax=Stomoxys calcitrans TaxID=35570 RepID=UPI0027E2DB3C|nr:peritrophin-44 isoform X1 [Stomoxys calcitrans]XP_013117615.2 peritrophin-44 isoform X2 [Stomoxys calcitrans]